MRAARVEFESFVSSVELIDHHVHAPLNSALPAEQLMDMFTESDRPVAAGTHRFDSQVGFAVRAHCAPKLGLERHASAEEYFAKRAEFTADQLAGTFLQGLGIARFLNDTGITNEITQSSEEFSRNAGAPVDEIVRIESEFERFADTVSGPAELIDGFAQHMATRTQAAVGLKSIVAYRYGFDFDPERPERGDALQRAAHWLEERHASKASLSDITLIRWALWTGVDTGLPIQMHSGYGDPDVDLHRCNPLLLTDFIRIVEPLGTQILLLHNYPYHREAGFLAHSFSNVYFDIGLAAHYTGAQSDALIRETLELTPFGKLLFSSDAWGPPELHFLGTMYWRRGMARAIGEWVEDDEWSLADAKRVTSLVGAENAARVYGVAL